MVAVTAAATKFTPVNQTRSTQTLKGDADERGAERKRRYPVIDYEAPEPADPEKRAIRKLKNKHYDKFGFAIRDSSPRVDEESVETDWSLHVPALPAAQSAAVVIGEVLSSEAHLSNDRHGVYSEFSVRVDEVLKGVGPGMEVGRSISVDRAGGFVQYPNGHKRLYRVAGQNMPRVAARYVLFLTASDGGQNYQILTAYELIGGKVSPLDESTRMSAYEGTAEDSFLQAVRNAITQASQATPG